MLSNLADGFENVRLCLDADTVMHFSNCFPRRLSLCHRELSGTFIGSGAATVEALSRSSARDQLAASEEPPAASCLEGASDGEVASGRTVATAHLSSLRPTIQLA